MKWKQSLMNLNILVHNNVLSFILIFIMWITMQMFSSVAILDLVKKDLCSQHWINLGANAPPPHPPYKKKKEVIVIKNICSVQYNVPVTSYKRDFV